MNKLYIIIKITGVNILTRVKLFTRVKIKKHTKSLVLEQKTNCSKMERVNLKRQNITKANYAIIQVLSFVLPYMETITDLEVVGKGFIQKDNIKKLTIIGDVPISVLERILKRCSTVTHLKLNKCINVNDECVNYILSKVTVSKELSIDRCFNITRLPYVSSSKKVDVKTKKCWRLEYYDIIENHEDLIEFVLFSAYIATHEVEDEIIYARLNLYCITDKIQMKILQMRIKKLV